MVIKHHAVVIAAALILALNGVRGAKLRPQEQQLRSSAISTSKQNRQLQFPDGFNLGDIDLGNLDWENIDFGDFDWTQIDLGDFEWTDFFNGDNADTGIVCPIVEGLVGIGQAFGVAGNCDCEGSILSLIDDGDGDSEGGLTIGCNFPSECIDPWVCGSLDLDIELGTSAGDISTNVCVDLIGDFPEICYGYHLNVADDTITQTCTASYGGNACKCDFVENSCLIIDCHEVLPGAVMDTCQFVNHMATMEDANNFVPRFQVMDPEYELSFANVDWPGLDWDNLDWANFDLNNFWTSQPDWMDTTWEDIFGIDFSAIDICPALEQFAGLSQAFGLAGGCTCDGSLADGLAIGCGFSEQCTDMTTGATDIMMISDIGGDSSPFCASVDFNVSVGTIPGEFSTDICINNWLNGTYPEICYSYDWSFLADATGVSEVCQATYGGNNCTCDIQDGCLNINCSAFHPGATMDTCQFLQTDNTNDASNYVPRFQIFQPDYELDFGQADWPNLDWENADWPNLDFDSFWNYTDGASDIWGDDSEWGNIFGGFEFDVDAICPALEQFAGLGQAFGVAGGCTCDGSLTEGLGIDCNFATQCLSDGDATMMNACGAVDFTVSLGETLGEFSSNVCVDWDDATTPYQEICYSYDLSFVDSVLTQSCTATYGGNNCTCDIEDACLSINCSNVLPGAVMDTCQHLDNLETDATNLVPRFQIFDPDFELAFGEVDWANLDWENLDIQNFDLNSLWNHSDWSNTDWSDIFNVGIDATTICPVLENLAGVGDEFGLEGGCTCSGDSATGLNLDCSFDDVCAPNNDALCGSTDVSFGFSDGLGSISGEACVDFAQDAHPTTCFSYDIPLADPNALPECTATYGDNSCDCTIDEYFCVSIDCSEHDDNAVTTTCQTLAWNTEADATSFVPRFAVMADDGTTQPPNNGNQDPTQAPAGGNVDDNDTQQDEGPTQEEIDNGTQIKELNAASGSGVATISQFAAGLVVVSLLLVL